MVLKYKCEKCSLDSEVSTADDGEVVEFSALVMADHASKSSNCHPQHQSIDSEDYDLVLA